MAQAAIVQEVEPVPNQAQDGGSQPTSPLHSLQVRPIPLVMAKKLLEREHYLHSLPGGTMLSFGVLLVSRLLGALTFGAGSYLAHRLVEGATRDDCLVLTRLWLSEDLPRNSESRVLGIIMRLRRSHTHLKFLVAYSDPSAGHMGTVYQASGWLYTGLSAAMLWRPGI